MQPKDFGAVGGQDQRTVAGAGPLDVPVLVQDVFRCLGLSARPGQWLL